MATEKATYSHGHHASVVKSHARRTAQNSAAFVLPSIKADSRILDIGCGPGSITIGFAKLAPRGQVIGGDSVASVIDQANQSAQAEGINNIEFRQMDGNALPFEDNSFDIVFCHQTLQHVGDPVGILKEMQRVAKSGGQGIVAAREADYQSFVWWPESPALAKWGDLYQKVGKANGAEPNAGRYLPSWAYQAGFAKEDVTFTWDSWNYQAEEAQAFGGAWVDRALHSGYKTTALQHKLTDEKELQTISQGWKEFSETDGRFIIIPNGEILCRVR